MNKLNLNFLFIAFLLLAAQTIKANVKTARAFSDNMVLQAGVDKIWNISKN